MQQGQKMILEAEKMMIDPRPEKFMTGSRTMMRGLRMIQKTDVKTADKLMADGQNLMMEAAKTMRDKKSSRPFWFRLSLLQSIKGCQWLGDQI